MNELEQNIAELAALMRRLERAHRRNKRLLAAVLVVMSIIVTVIRISLYYH